MNRKKWIIGMMFIMGSISYLVYSGVKDTGLYYITVNELLSAGDRYVDKGVRIAGNIEKGTVRWDQKTLDLSFTLKQENIGVPIIYKGPLPDTFKEGRQAVVEGHLDSGKKFRAEKIMAKCPSKYEMKKMSGADLAPKKSY